MKFILASVIVIALGDVAMNHGNGTHHVIQATGSFFHWLAHAGEGSLFTW